MRLTASSIAASALGLLLLAAPLAGQGAPLDAFRANIAAIHARDRAAYLSHYLQTPALARVGPDGLHQGYEEFARGAGAGWPDTLVATHFRIVPVTPEVAYGVYRYRVVDSSGSVRGVSERVLVRTPAGWKVAVTTAFPTPDAAPPPIAIVGATLVDGTGAPALRNAVVIMREGRIACAGRRAACPVPADADTVGAAGKWIIPGLIDTHVHFSQTGWVDGRPDALDLRDRYPYETVEAELHARPERFFRSYLCSGVTSVFDVGGYPWTLDLQARTARSTTAPRVLAGRLPPGGSTAVRPRSPAAGLCRPHDASQGTGHRHGGARAAPQRLAARGANGTGRPIVRTGPGEPQAGARCGHSHCSGHRRRQRAHAARRVGVHGARGDAGLRPHGARRARGRDRSGGSRPRARQHRHRRRWSHGGPGGAGRRSARRHPQRPADRPGGAPG